MSDIRLTIIAENDDPSKKTQYLKKLEAINAKMGGQLELLLVETPASLEDAENPCVAEELNAAFVKAKGEFICFSQVSCDYDDQAFVHVLKAFDRNPSQNIISINPIVYDQKGVMVSQLRYFDYFKSGQLDLDQDIHYWNQCLFSLFLRKSLIKDLKFDSRLKYEYAREYYAKLYSIEPKYLLLKDKVVALNHTELDFYNYKPQYNLDWYQEEFDTMSELLSKDSTPIKQRILMDFIRLQYACNLNGRDKTIVVGKDLEDYEARVKATLSHIDDDVIVMYDDRIRKRLLKRFTGHYFLTVKYGTSDFDIQVVDDPKEEDLADGYNSTVFKVNGTYLENLDKVNINVWAMNYKDGQLYIDGEIVSMYFEKDENYDVVLLVDGKEYPVTKNEIYSHTKLFGKVVKQGWTFRCSFPVDDFKGKRKAQFVLRYRDIRHVLHWKFVKAQARLTEEHRYSYWSFAGRFVKYQDKERALCISKAAWYKTLGHEIRYWYGALKYGDEFDRAFKSVILRMVYYITKPYYSRKNIWITFDQLFKGGDNGEYFYRYVCEHGDPKNQKLYYVVNKNTKEYKELARLYGEDTLLPFNSFKHKLITLHAKMILTTRADAILYGGYFSKTARYFRGLFNCEISCLQHGLTIQQIAQYQNRLFDNLKYYFCVSKYEVENIKQPIYGYDDPSILKLTGAPRYDGLKSNPKKQIIITPTWRRNVTAGTNAKGSNNSYSVNFKHTKYFEIYNSLINDKRLIEAAKNHGYKLIYLIHPILSPQINDFDTNDYTEIIPGSKVNYEKILTESALMLTDHSGIMYDFAYQRKPLVYYHPDELPPQYGEGGLKYETMGFGPVCRTHDQVVDALVSLIENDCQLSDMYRQRIDDFFEFDDFDNCKRVYEAACAFQNGLRY